MGTTSTEIRVLSADAQAKKSDYEWLMRDFQVAAGLMDRNDLMKWGSATAGFFVGGVGSRAGNIVRLVGKIGSGAGTLATEGYDQARNGSLWQWTKDKIAGGYEDAKDLVTSGYERSTEIVSALRTNPAQMAPELATTVLMTFLVSGGPDGNGGAPDLDLMFGIDAHRSLFTHSILMGAAIETSIRSVLHFVQLVHVKLPADRHPWWDSALAFSNHIGDAAVTGTNYGMAYHLFVDGIVQPGSYHSLPFSMPLEGHQALTTGNAIAEGMEPARRARQTTVPSVSSGDWKAQHKALIDKPFPVGPQIEAMLEPEHACTVRRYGTWFEALDKGLVEPRTAAQEQFVACSKGARDPKTLHEVSWFGFKLARSMQT